MDNIGVVCFSCNYWSTNLSKDSKICPTEEYSVFIVLDCPMCNPEKYEGVRSE